MHSLEEHTSAHRDKLARRLARQGLQSISELPYETYLRSALWREIRGWIFSAQNGRCFICDRKATEVHHHDYTEETMWGEKSEGLAGLCARCHDLVEFKDTRIKRDSLEEKRTVFEQLRLSFSSLKSDGFHLVIERDGLTVRVKHIGNPEFQKFIDCASLAYEFLVSLIHKDVAIPLPFGKEKLSQRTGVRLSLRRTSKQLATVWAEAGSITIKHTRACGIPIEEHLRNHLRSKPYVNIVA